MEFIEHIKNRIGRFLLEREISQHHTQRNFKTYHDIQTIGIVYSADIKDQEELVFNYANTLRQEGKKVFTMGYVNDKQLPFNKKFSLQSEYFWKEKNNGFNLPIKGKIGRFLDMQFDVLLNLYDAPLLPLQAIAAYSKASYRIGPHIEGGLDYYDGMIDTGANKDLSFLISQIDFYLKAIK